MGRPLLILNGRLPFLQGISTLGREVSSPPPPHSANHKSSTSLQLVTGQDPGQTLPPSKSDSPPPHWRQPSLWGWGWGGVRGPTGTDLSPEAGLEECSGQFYRQQGEGAGLDP